MSTYLAKTANKIRQNGGSAMNAGTNNGTSPISAERLKSKENDLGVFGSKVIGKSDVNTASFLGDVAELNDLNTTLNTLYQVPRPDLTNSIHKTESSRTLLYTTAFRNGYYNMFTGDFFVDPTSQLDTFSKDDAASPSRETPGELTYRTGKPTPVSQKYEAKNG